MSFGKAVVFSVVGACIAGVAWAGLCVATGLNLWVLARWWAARRGTG